MTSPSAAARKTTSQEAPVGLAAALRIAVLRLSRRLRVERSDEALTMSQLSALSSLAHEGPCSPTTLAEVERIQPPSMTRIIAALEAHGYAARAPHPSDGRQSVIAITPAGAEVLEETRRLRTAWLVGALEELSPAEREQLATALPLIERLSNH